MTDKDFRETRESQDSNQRFIEFFESHLGSQIRIDETYGVVPSSR